MFFEGSEKKAEIFVDTHQLSLLTDLDTAFWSALVECSNAKILSSIENGDCKAFLLSESSLFIWHDRLLILTCGETSLVKAVEFFIQKLGANVVKQLTYQRKNEYFASAQLSCFGDDIKVINSYLPGKAYRFGEMDSHHNYIFHLNKHSTSKDQCTSHELIAYQISEAASAHLTQQNLSKHDIRHFLRIDKILPDFIIDDFVFTPYGYSLNAIKAKQYLTIHVTPQAESSYVSFESNLDILSLAPLLLDILKPKSFDLMSINGANFTEKLNKNVPTNYISKSRVSQSLSRGYLVNFANFILPQTSFTAPVEIDVLAESHSL